MSRPWWLLLLSWLIAAGATLGALFLGEVVGMTPCVLCWYQRIFMFPLALVLGMAAFLEDRRGALYGFWLAVCGLAVAVYHNALLAGVVPKSWTPCSAGGVSCTDQKLDILNGLQIPWLSLAAFFAVTLLLAIYLRKTPSK